MNKRNIEIFGYENFKIERRHVISGILLVLFTAALIWFIFPDKKAEIPITSGAVASLPVEENLGIDEAEEAIAGDYVEEAADKEFYEYGGQCSFDVKHAQDDINDVNNYLGQYMEEHERLSKEYSSKLAELEEEYKPVLSRLEIDIKRSEEDLEKAQSKLDEVKKACEF